MVDLSNVPVFGKLFGGKKAEGATPPPDPEPKPLEPISEVKPLVEEPVKTHDAEVKPLNSAGAESMGTANADKPEAAQAPVEGAQTPPETPEG